MAPACADGVVIRSASPAYPVGRVVQAGEDLRLRTGETLTVLARAGGVQHLSGPAATYRDPAGRPDPDVAERALRAMRGPADAAAIGGTRGDRTCLEIARRERVASVDHCFGSAAAAPKLLLALTGNGPRAHGERIYLRLTANFTGHAVCVRRASGAEPAFLAGAVPANPLALEAGVPLTWPGRGAEGLRADDGSGEVLVTCHAVESRAWPVNEPQVLAAMTPMGAQSIVQGLARLAKASSADASLRVAAAR